VSVLICDTTTGDGGEGDLYGNCPEHGKYLYFCKDCHDRWAEEHPRTAAAIQLFAAGRGSSAAVAAARKADALTPAPVPPVAEGKG
jgi:hypothetical protein